jgi:hypothetical protein
VRNGAHHRRNRQGRQRRRTVGNAEFRQPNRGEGKGVAIERFRRGQVEEWMRQNARDEVLLGMSAGGSVAFVVV